MEIKPPVWYNRITTKPNTKGGLTMLKNEPKQFNLHSILYNKIPEDHILKKLNSVLDFSFINNLLEDSYCKYCGRPAKEPEKRKSSWNLLNLLYKKEYVL